MRFLICGLGSIGQRHFKNLKAIGCNEVACYRTSLGSDNSAVNALLLEHMPPQFNDFQAALKKWKPDVVLVTNPTSLHVPVALEAAKAGCHILIEKPVWHRYGQELDELLSVVDAKKLKVAIAYHWRFNLLLGKLRNLLRVERIGLPIVVRSFVGEQVADWHSWEDHRVSYACRKDLGGGVILTLSHDLDMLYWLFGKPEQIAAVGGNLVHKDIDVEDTAEIVMRFKGGPAVSLHMDYWQPKRARELEVFGVDFRLGWSPNSLSVMKSGRGGKVVANDEFHDTADPETARNAMHLDMLKHFLVAIDGGPMDPLCDLWQAVDVLDMALAAKNQIYVPQKRKVTR